MPTYGTGNISEGTGTPTKGRTSGYSPPMGYGGGQYRDLSLEDIIELIQLMSADPEKNQGSLGKYQTALYNNFAEGKYGKDVPTRSLIYQTLQGTPWEDKMQWWIDNPDRNAQGNMSEAIRSMLLAKQQPQGGPPPMGAPQMGMQQGGPPQMGMQQGGQMGAPQPPWLNTLRR